LNAQQRDLVIASIKDVCEHLRLQLYAVAVMQDHVHFASARHRVDIESIIGSFKRVASRALTDHGFNPMGDAAHPNRRPVSCWVKGGWKRYLNSPGEIAGVIEYIRGNPIRAGLGEQRFDWETPFVWFRAPRNRGG
jgi:REP element-mobilizing transposase RayT